MVDEPHGADEPRGPDEDNGPDEAALAVVARHALHDEELVAALATGSLDDEVEIGRAQSFVDRCTACRSLHDDIAAIGAAIRSDARGTINAPRDFRLTVEDARHLGGSVRVGGLPAGIRRAISSFGRPVGASMAAFGIVGLLVGSMSLAGGGSAAGPTAVNSGATAATHAPAELGTDPGPDGPKASGRSAAYAPGTSAGYVQTGGGGTETPQDTAMGGASPVAILLGGSVALLVFGVGLLVVAIRRDP